MYRQSQAVTQPQHGLEFADCAPCGVKGREPPILGISRFTQKVVALDALLQALGHVVGRHAG